MAENSAIEWTDHTGNLWWGCTEKPFRKGEVHPGCVNCYARTWDHRYKGDHWGDKKPRRLIKNAIQNFYKWQRKAEAEGTFYRVFVGSMMDIFERSRSMVDFYGAPVEMMTGDLRETYFRDVVPNTPNLLHLMLTKRPENILKMIPAEWVAQPPQNVMYGYSPVDQATADFGIPYLLKVPGKHFLSCEPLVGPLDLNKWLLEGGRVSSPMEAAEYDCWPSYLIDWVITGGESGVDARPMHPAWARSLRDQCQAAEVPFFFKQWGEWVDSRQVGAWGLTAVDNYKKYEVRGGRLEGSAFECNHKIYDHAFIKVGKHQAGRLLDGREWSEFPVMELV